MPENAPQMIISVGISTSGYPELEKHGEYTLLKNMLIGKNFHWQRTIEALLPGEIEITDNPEFQVINRLLLEKYLECVVGSEMNPEAPEEFLKAHAIISRSWAVGKITGSHSHCTSGKVDLPDRIVNWEDTSDHVGFDVCSDDHCQRYQGIQPIPATVKNVLKATEGEVLIDQPGRLIDARFSKCCGGRTELFSSCWQSREEPCLKSFDDPWCNLKGLTTSQQKRILHSILKDYDFDTFEGLEWEANVSAEEIATNLHQKFNRNIGHVSDIRVSARGASGRATNLLLTGTEGTLEIGKELMIRKLLSPTHLFSSWFDIFPISEGKWLLKGRGWGHGVGLCQIGAANMALQGFSCRDILSFYYPASKIVRYERYGKHGNLENHENHKNLENQENLENHKNQFK